MRIINIMAASVDGMIASSATESDAMRQRYGFSNEADRRHLISQLAQCDAVIVSAHSVNISGGVIRDDRIKQHPTWIMCTNSGMDVNAPAWRYPQVPKWTLSRHALPVDKVGNVERQCVYGDGCMVETALQACQIAGFERILLFGGGQINRAFYSAGKVDELILTVCPVAFGTAQGVPLIAPDLPAPVRFRIRDARTEQNLVFIHYLVQS